MSASLFEVWDVTGWEGHSDETEGQEEKWWLIDPSTNEIWLFKPPVVKNGVRQGEDWAERVSTELAVIGSRALRWSWGFEMACAAACRAI